MRLRFDLDLTNENDVVSYEHFCKSQGAQYFVERIAEEISNLRNELEVPTSNSPHPDFTRGQISALRDMAECIMRGTLAVQSFEEDKENVNKEVSTSVDKIVRYTDEQNTRMSLYDIRK